MLTCVNEKRAATVAAAAAGRWREARQGRAYTRLSRGRYAVAAHKRGEPFYAVVAQRRGEPFARGAETRRGARYTRAGSWRGGRAAEHAAGPRDERGAPRRKRLVSGSRTGCRKVALGRTATESIGTILSLSWQLERTFDSCVSGFCV